MKAVKTGRHFHSICNLSGLDVVSSPEWEDIRVGNNYSVSFKIIDSKFIYTRVVGYSDEIAVQEAIQFRETILNEFFSDGKPFIIIEDYSRLEGASPGSRKHFIQYVRNRENLQGLVFVTNSPIMRMTISMGMKLYQLPFPVRIVRNYFSAIMAAKKIFPLLPLASYSRKNNAYQTISLPISSSSTEDVSQLFDGIEYPKMKNISSCCTLVDFAEMSKSQIMRLRQDILAPTLNPDNTIIFALSAKKRPFYVLFLLNIFMRKIVKNSPFKNWGILWYNCSWKNCKLLNFLMPSLYRHPQLHLSKNYISYLDLRSYFENFSEEKTYSTYSIPSWQYKNANFYCRYEILNNKIPHCFVEGTLEEKELTNLLKIRSIFEDYCRTHSTYSILFIDVENLKKSRFRVRNRYLTNLKNREEKFFKKLVFYGKNNYYKAFISLGSSIFKKQLSYYPTLETALKSETINNSDKPPFFKRWFVRKKISRNDELVSEIMNFISNMNWTDSTGIELPHYDHSHPLHTVFDALAFIKMDIDELFKEKEMKEQALVQSRQKYKDIFNNVSDLMYFHDLNGKLTQINKPFRQLLGLSENENFDLSIYDLVPDKFSDQIDDYLKKIRNTGSAEGLVRIQTKQGSTVILEYKNSLVIEDGTAVLVRGSAHDVTQQIHGEKMLRESLERYKAILDNIEEGYYETDMNGHITFFNDALCRILEMDKMNLIFQEDVLYGLGENREQISRQFKKVFKTGESTRNFEIEFITQSGKKVLEISISLVRSPKGMRKGFRGIVKDITHRKLAEIQLQQFNENLLESVEQKTKELKESNSRYSQILSSIQDGYYEADLSGKIIHANQALCDMIQMNCSEIIGKTMKELVDRKNYILLRKHYLSVLKTGVPKDRVEWEFVAPDGTIKVLENSISLLHSQDGEPEGFMGIIRDITPRIKMEQELLEQKKQAEYANNAKSQFLANMSHEIRTPLNGIIGMVDLAKETLADTNQIDILNTIEKEANSLLEIINEVLDYSKIEAGKLNLEFIPFPIYSFINELSESYSLRAYHKNLDFYCYIDPQIPTILVGDPGKIRQILNNLVGNAIKFTHQGSVELSIEIKRKYKSKIVLLIKINDTGIGIAKEKQKIIFESFTQEDGSMTRKYGGSGLGTTITKQLVELMGGKISLKSKKEKGTQFTIELKLNIHPNSEKDCFLSLPDDVSYKKIIIVEDNLRNRSILEKYLNALNFTDITPMSSSEFYETHFQPAPDIIIFNTLLTQIESFTKIKQFQTFHPDVQIIYITPPGFHKKTLLSYRHSNEQYIVKPISIQKLHQIFQPSRNQAPQPFTYKNPAQSAASLQLNDKKVTILLVEDYETNQQVVQKYLNAAGLNVDIANNGEVAIKMFQDKYYDLVLMDVQMPVMDGYSATNEIRLFETGIRKKTNTGIQTFEIHTPIIGLTAHVSKRHREECIEAGMDDVLTKPFSRQDLLNKVFEWLHQAPSSPAKSTISPNKTSHVPSFEYAKLLQEFDSDTEFLDEVVFSFLQHAREQVASIQRAVEKEDFEHIFQEAHSIKGGSGNIMAADCWKTAKEIEMLGRKREIIRIPKLCKKLLQQLFEFEQMYIQSRKGDKT